MSKSVSQFLLGIDLSSVELNDNDCSETFSNMTRIQWLKMTGTGINKIPKGVEKLTQLQRLTVSKNQIEHLTGDWYTNLKSLRVFNARKNKISDKSLPDDLFNNIQLQVVDLSFNYLSEVPPGLCEARSLLVLNLSDNKIQTIPKELFANCSSLMVLDLSNNRIVNFPTNLRRMPNLQSLNLSNNPLTLSQLRSISGLKKLTTLLLSNTSRRLESIPSDLDKLSSLQNLDISENKLPKVPQTIYEISSLTKLNLSGNNIDELSCLIDCWPNLEVLNLSRNRLCSLPSFIIRLSKLKKLYIDNNQLTFNGIPPGIGKLTSLEVFSAADNQLENIPEGLCRCGQLKHLNLQMNHLVALPDAINVLRESLITFNIENNPNLKMPLKFDEVDSKAKYAFYNIDFSLETQMQLARGAPTKPATKNLPQKDNVSRIRRLRRKKVNEQNDTGRDSKQVLEGMQKVAKDKDAVLEEREREEKQLTARRWQDAIVKPNLDYSKLFEEDVGNSPGVEIWEIDEFYPRRVSDELAFGSFYDGDCYIVLHTDIDEKSHNILYWSIFYWIGKQATLDKVTCAAVHAVNLRNFLGADCRCERIEQEDESDEFRALFDGNITVFEGARGETGFMKIDDKPHRKKMYRLFGADKSISIFALNPSPDSLDSKFVYLYDESVSRIFLWFGSKSRLMLQTKGRLLADNINQTERKGQSEIIIERENFETEEFKSSLEDPENDSPTDWQSLVKENVPLSWCPPPPILYDVKLGKGFLEMPQVELPNGRLVKSLLQVKQVFILDSNGDIFVWLGDMSPKFLKFAGLKLAYELLELLPRSSRRSPIVCCQSAEPHVFKMQFSDWVDTFAVDFTRSVESVRKRGIDPNEFLEKDKMKIDMRAFFMPREKPISWEEAKDVMDNCNDDLVESDDSITNGNPFRIKQFVYQNKKWILVENKWVGHFFNQDSYIVHAEYWELAEDEDTEEESIQTVIYFWQGREASDIPWLQFSFSIKKEMELKFSGMNDMSISKDALRKVETQRMHQQQEISTFLAHFQHRFVIHLGRYQDRYSDQRKNRVEFFYMRENGSALCTRTIEVKPLLAFLNSCFHYVMKVPSSLAGTEEDQIFCWIGRHSDPHYHEVIRTVATDTFPEVSTESVRTVLEGEEPELFWRALGGAGAGGTGQRCYDTEAEFMQHARLFRLSNEQGFFCASEKCSDFCQDDLADEDAMLLDTGAQVYLWFGNRTSDVEKKLSVKAAKLYHEHLARVQPDAPRQLKITQKKKEPHNFRRCFHGWGPFKEAKDWSG